MPINVDVKNPPIWFVMIITLTIALLFVGLIGIISEVGDGGRNSDIAARPIRVERFEIAKVTCYHNHYGISCLKD